MKVETVIRYGIIDKYKFKLSPKVFYYKCPVFAIFSLRILIVGDLEVPPGPCFSWFFMSIMLKGLKKVVHSAPFVRFFEF